MGSSSVAQGRVVLRIHPQIFLLLLVTLRFVGRRTVNEVVIVVAFELVTDLIPAESSATATT